MYRIFMDMSAVREGTIASLRYNDPVESCRAVLCCVFCTQDKISEFVSHGIGNHSSISSEYVISSLDTLRWVILTSCKSRLRMQARQPRLKMMKQQKQLPRAIRHPLKPIKQPNWLLTTTRLYLIFKKMSRKTKSSYHSGQKVMLN
jgi:hypothetical protein